MQYHTGTAELLHVSVRVDEDGDARLELDGVTVAFLDWSGSLVLVRDRRGKLPPNFPLDSKGRIKVVK